MCNMSAVSSSSATTCSSSKPTSSSLRLVLGFVPVLSLMATEISHKKFSGGRNFLQHVGVIRRDPAVRVASPNAAENPIRKSGFKVLCLSHGREFLASPRPLAWSKPSPLFLFSFILPLPFLTTSSQENRQNCSYCPWVQGLTLCEWSPEGTF